MASNPPSVTEPRYRPRGNVARPDSAVRLFPKKRSMALTISSESFCAIAAAWCPGAPAMPTATSGAVSFQRRSSAGEYVPYTPGPGALREG